MKYSGLIIPAALASSALAAPAGLEERATTFCGQFDSTVTSPYTIFNNLWGEASATSGSQCTTVTGIVSGKLVWSTSFSWAGGQGDVKSYANAQIFNLGKELSSITTIPTTWDWIFTGTNIVADVSYDTFLAPSASGTVDYEVMIWLAAIGGAGPISSTGSTPAATVTIGSATWNLFKGPNGSTTVFSFVAETEQTNFTGDLMLFYTYLINNQGVPKTHFLTSIGSGTEPFSATNAVLTNKAFSVVVN